MVANATKAGKDKCVYGLDSRSGKNSIDWCTSVPKCWRDWDACVMPTNFGEVKIILGKTAGETASIDIFIKISKKDDIVIKCLPSNQLRNELLKKYGP
jgi:hypothetical protein